MCLLARVRRAPGSRHSLLGSRHHRPLREAAQTHVHGYLPDTVEVAFSFPEETRSSGTLQGILAAMGVGVLALAAPAATLYWEGVPYGSFAESANWSLSLGGDVPWSGGMPGAEDTLVFSLGSACGTPSGILGGVSSG
ncbi:MAG: hypothetical protein RLZZ142_1085, partial [Verrucomicrobiota bacterium]